MYYVKQVRRVYFEPVFCNYGCWISGRFAYVYWSETVMRSHIMHVHLNSCTIFTSFSFSKPFSTNFAISELLRLFIIFGVLESIHSVFLLDRHQGPWIIVRQVNDPVIPWWPEKTAPSAWHSPNYPTTNASLWYHLSFHFYRLVKNFYITIFRGISRFYVTTSLFKKLWVGSQSTTSLHSVLNRPTLRLLRLFRLPAVHPIVTKMQPKESFRVVFIVK